MYTTLISAEALQALSATTLLLDCRATLGNPDAGRQAYLAGHIAGAQHLSLDHDLAAPAGDGGRHPLPDREALAERLRQLGARQGQQIVVYDDAGGAFAARAWWCIRWLGHEAVAVLDGSMGSWSEPLEKEEPAAPRGDFSARAPLTRTIDVKSLEAELATRSLIDARTEARYLGREEPIDPVAGHIPGAVCLPFQGNLAGDGRFLATEELRARFAELEPDGNTVCYCGSGVTAAHNVLALVAAGYPEPTLYVGSFSEWLRDPARPIGREAGA